MVVRANIVETTNKRNIVVVIILLFFMFGEFKMCNEYMLLNWHSQKVEDVKLRIGIIWRVSLSCRLCNPHLL